MSARRRLWLRLATVAVCFAAVAGVAALSQQAEHRPGDAAGVMTESRGRATPAPANGSPVSGPAQESSVQPSPGSSTAVGPTAVVHRRLNPCERTLALARRMGTSFDIGSRRVDVLGDSYSVGTTLAEPRTQTWDVLLAQHLGWRLTVRGIGRTGFVNGGTCGGNDYQTRVEQVLADRPKLVVVQGGLNDVGYVDRVWQAASRLLASIPTDIDIIVIGPPAAPAFRYTAEQRVDETLRAAVAATHGTYVSTLGWPLSYAGDGIHLDAAGNKVFAERLSAVIGAAA